MHQHVVRVMLAALTMVAVSIPAAAQDRPAGTVSVSYAALKDSDVDGLFGKGWVADVSGKVSRSIDLVAEATGSYKTIKVPSVGVETDIRIYGFTGGPRFVTRPAPRVTAFVQGLAGAVHASAGLSACGSLPPSICNEARAFRVSRTFFGIQPGVGVDIALKRRVGIRLGADYRAVFVTAEDDDGEGTVLHEFRFGGGVVFRFGR